MLYENLLVFILFKFKKHPNISGIRVVKTVQLTAFYGKITRNVWLDLLQFFPVYSTGT